MVESQQIECMELIETLFEGDMLSHPVIRRHVDHAIHTGDCKPLYDFLEGFPLYRALAARNIALARYQKLDNPYRPYPDHDEVIAYLSGGPTQLGYVNELSDMFRVPWDVLRLPVIILGRVGSGKSELLKYLSCQILRQSHQFNTILPDLKREYRNLLPIARHLKALTNERIKINPLVVPPWMSPLEHAFFFSKVFTRENYLGGTSQNLLIPVLEYLYRRRGILDGNTTNYPTMKDLYRVISSQLEHQKSFKYRDLLLWLQNRLYPYTMCEAFNCRIGIPFEVWREENLVLEMDKGFTDNMYSFLVSYLLGLRYTYNKEMGLTGRLSTLFIIDEARLLSNANRDTSIYGESYYNETITKTRDFGVSSISASQESATFTQTLRSIAYLKIALPLNDAKDLAFIRESFGLDDEQAAYVFRLPRYATAVVRYGGFERPFLLAVPHFVVKKRLSDADVEERMAGFYSGLDDRMRNTKSPLPVEITEAIPPAASALLYSLSKEPFTKVSEMTTFSGFKSPVEVNKGLSWLEDNGYVRREEYRTSKRGRKSAFAVLTEKAYAYLDAKPPPGKGTFEHKLYQHIIPRWLSARGWDAKLEGRIKGTQKSIDVLAYSKDRGYVAYEVTIHFENLLSNIHQDIRAGVSEVVIITRTKEEMEKAVELVSADRTLSENLGQVTFSTIDEFFE